MALFRLPDEEPLAHCDSALAQGLLRRLLDVLRQETHSGARAPLPLVRLPWHYPPPMSLPGGWELIIVLVLMLALVGFAISRIGPRR